MDDEEDLIIATIFCTFEIQSRSTTGVNTGNLHMAREYPRFLFSNPQNTKSKGPFIISTVPPLIICKVHFKTKIINVTEQAVTTIELERLAVLANKPDGSGFGHQIKETEEAMEVWLLNQLQSGVMKL